MLGSIAACSMIISAPTSSTTPAPSSASVPSVGTIIEAAISMLGRQPWPRKRIQATIGSVIVNAISISIGPVPSTWKTASAGAPSTTMPSTITTIISR